MSQDAAETVSTILWVINKKLEKQRLQNWVRPIYDSLEDHTKWSLTNDGDVCHNETGIVLRLYRLRRWIFWSKYRVAIIKPVEIHYDCLRWAFHLMLAPKIMELQTSLLKKITMPSQFEHGAGI